MEKEIKNDNQPMFLNINGYLINVAEVLSISPLNKKGTGVMIRFKTDKNPEGTFYNVPFEEVEKTIAELCKPIDKKKS